MCTMSEQPVREPLRPDPQVRERCIRETETFINRQLSVDGPFWRSRYVSEQGQTAPRGHPGNDLDQGVAD